MTHGLAAAALVVAAAFGLSAAVPAVPAMSLCVLAGALLRTGLSGKHQGDDDGSPGPSHPAARAVWAQRLTPGLNVASSTLMRAGIVLLGLQLSVADIAALGWVGVTATLAVVVLAFAGTWAAAKAFRLPGDQPVLLATGFSICGASAIGAMSQARGTTRDSSVPLALVTLCGTLSIALFPLANVWLGLPPAQFGHWVGASVHDVGQVVATANIADGLNSAAVSTASAATTTALAAAVVVKLLRVLALAPATALGAWQRRRSLRAGSFGADGAEPALRGGPLVPLFVVGFAAAVALRSTGLLPAVTLDAAHVLQEILLGMALVGLGFSINLRTLFPAAWKATAAALIAWVFIAALGLAAAVVISSESFML